MDYSKINLDGVKDGNLGFLACHLNKDDLKSIRYPQKCRDRSMIYTLIHMRACWYKLFRWDGSQYLRDHAKQIGTQIDCQWDCKIFDERTSHLLHY